MKKIRKKVIDGNWIMGSGGWYWELELECRHWELYTSERKPKTVVCSQCTKDANVSLNKKSLEYRQFKRKNRRVIKRRVLPKPHCTCNEEYIEPHVCPFSVEIDEDYTECTCCDYCTDECANGI